jgi:diguanylate cyclase (GGDEF)-like protein
MRRTTTICLGAFLLLYLTWQAFRWIPGDVASIGDAFFLPVGAVAVLACWMASRRCGQIPRLRWFWRLMALAVAAQLAGDSTMAAYDLAGAEPPFPSLADLAYLCFYPLTLLALLRIPVAPTSHAQRVRLALDLATALVAGGMVIWHLVLAQTVSEGGQSAVQMLTSVAYPVGDLVLLAGLGVVLLRWSPPIMHRPLSLIAVALAMFIVADVVYSYTQLRGGYEAGGPIDTLWIAALSLFALAGMSQRQARPGTSATTVPAREVSEQRVSWFPFVALAVGGLVLVRVEWTRAFVPALTLVLAAIGLAALIAIRQYVTQKEMIRLQNDLRQAHDRLSALASQDALTSVANRRTIEEKLAGEVERARRYGRNLSLLFLDLDDFKTINDRLGHAAGDRVLAEFATIFRSCLRPTDIPGRWGGEEFIAVLPETGVVEAGRAAERIRARVQAHCFSLDGAPGPTCSVGVSSYPDDATRSDDLVHSADCAMYAAKRGGRNRVVTASHASPWLESA